MNGRLTAWWLGGLISVGGAALAQDDQHGVQKEDVKTWVATADGEEYEVRPAAPSYHGDTVLFHVSSAYTLPKGKGALSLFRDNSGKTRPAPRGLRAPNRPAVSRRSRSRPKAR